MSGGKKLSQKKQPPIYSPAEIRKLPYISFDSWAAIQLRLFPGTDFLFRRYLPLAPRPTERVRWGLVPPKKKVCARK